RRVGDDGSVRFHHGHGPRRRNGEPTRRSETPRPNPRGTRYAFFALHLRGAARVRTRPVGPGHSALGAGPARPPRVRRPIGLGSVASLCRTLPQGTRRFVGSPSIPRRVRAVGPRPGKRRPPGGTRTAPYRHRVSREPFGRATYASLIRVLRRRIRVSPRGPGR